MKQETQNRISSLLQLKKRNKFYQSFNHYVFNFCINIHQLQLIIPLDIKI